MSIVVGPVGTDACTRLQQRPTATVSKVKRQTIEFLVTVLMGSLTLQEAMDHSE